MALLMQQGNIPVFPQTLDQTGWLIRNSVIARSLEYGLAALTGNEGKETNFSEDTDPLVLKHYLAVLNQFIDLIRENGAKPIYVIMGGRLNKVGHRRELQYSRKGAELAREKDVPVIDAQQIVDRNPQSELFSPTGVHWSALGAKQLAALIDLMAFRGHLEK